MAVNHPQRLPAATVKADRAALLALKKLDDYTPATPALSVQAISALEEKLRTVEEAEILAGKGHTATRDARDAAEWDLHDAMLKVKSSVSAQYGYNSDAVQALGLKKKMDHRRPARRRTKPSV